MSYKMKGFSGFKSPLKQDYKILTTHKELEDARKRMNRRADAVEEIKNIGKEKKKKDKIKEEVNKLKIKREKEREEEKIKKTQ